MKPLEQHVDYPTYLAMKKAMNHAQSIGRWTTPNLNNIEYAAITEYLTTYRGLGQQSAYGHLQHGINEDAKSHTIRGFIIGWHMAKAHSGTPTP